jgi:hypothetical protein
MPVEPRTEAPVPPNPPPPPAAPSRYPSPPAGSGAAADSRASANRVKLNLANPHQSLPSLAKKEDARYREWLARELARLRPYELARVLKALAEIRAAQESCVTTEAFDEWLDAPDHKKLKAVYDDYLNPNIAVGLKPAPAPLDPIEAWLFDSDNNHLNAKSIVGAARPVGARG